MISILYTIKHNVNIIYNNRKKYKYGPRNHIMDAIRKTDQLRVDKMDTNSSVKANRSRSCGFLKKKNLGKVDRIVNGVRDCLNNQGQRRKS